ncbi:hypothetical protein INR49_012103, partial [Caranx melampygus]
MGALTSIQLTFHPVHHLARAPFAHRLHHQRHRGNFALTLRCAQAVSLTQKRALSAGRTSPDPPALLPSLRPFPPSAA